MNFQLPREGLDVGQLFVQLEREKSGRGIKEWGLSQTSLEDVFVNIVGNIET